MYVRWQQLDPLIRIAMYELLGYQLHFRLKKYNNQVERDRYIRQSFFRQWKAAGAKRVKVNLKDRNSEGKEKVLGRGVAFFAPK